LAWRAFSSSGCREEEMVAPVKSRAIVLRRYPLGETSRVVVCYTREHGKVRLIAKGIRKGGGRFGAALDPFVVSGVVFYLRRGRGLSLVSQAETEREFRRIRGDIVRQAYAAVALELVDRLVADQAPDPALFDRMSEALAGLDASPEEDLGPLLWSFVLFLADSLGYAPELEKCVMCGRQVTVRGGFSTASGGAVCGECAPAGCDFGPDVVALLRRLRAGAEPPSMRDVSDSLGEEVGRSLVSLLEHHAGQRLDLRSKAVLESLKKAGRSREGRGPNREEEN